MILVQMLSPYNKSDIMLIILLANEVGGWLESTHPHCIFTLRKLNVEVSCRLQYLATYEGMGLQLMLHMYAGWQCFKELLVHFTQLAQIACLS